MKYLYQDDVQVMFPIQIFKRFHVHCDRIRSEYGEGCYDKFKCFG